MSDFAATGSLPAGARALVLTISDGVAAGSRQDESGIVLADRLALAGFRVDRITVADDRVLVEQALRSAAAGHELVISTGGTGLTPRDVTPQATLAVIDYEVPGLAEAMRAAGRATTPLADLSRGVVGVIGRSLVVNVPGSPKAALESLAALEPTLGHALETLAGPFDHGKPGAGAAMPGVAGASTVQAPSASSTPDSATQDSATPDAATPVASSDDDWVPRPDDNDEWRDLPERGSQ
jgi:molybdenum cofactor biosynthesis protein B